MKDFLDDLYISFGSMITPIAVFLSAFFRLNGKRSNEKIIFINGSPVLIDKEFCDTISYLNMNGIYTSYCCHGIQNAGDIIFSNHCHQSYIKFSQPMSNDLILFLSRKGFQIEGDDVVRSKLIFFSNILFTEGMSDQAAENKRLGFELVKFCDQLNKGNGDTPPFS